MPRVGTAEVFPRFPSTALPPSAAAPAMTGRRLRRSQMPACGSGVCLLFEVVLN